MSEAFIGEIRLMSFIFAPRGWSQCNGQTLRIANAQALFSLIGNAYGGDGRETFQLPDLRGRIPVATGDHLPVGTTGGAPRVALTALELPPHTHQLFADGATPTDRNASTPFPNGSLGASGARFNPGGAVPMDIYGGPTPDRMLAAGAIASAGGGAPHENRQPFQVLNYCIALQGYFPSRG